MDAAFGVRRLAAAFKHAEKALKARRPKAWGNAPGYGPTPTRSAVSAAASISIPLLALLAILTLSGCATPYMRDRGRDALDIATATVDYQTFGASARVGPTSLGLLASAEIWRTGLRGGEVLKPREVEGFFAFLERLNGTIVAWYFEIFKPDSVDEADLRKDPGNRDPRRKTIRVEPLFGWLPVLSVRAEDQREKTWAPPYYFTQVEARVGLYGGLRLGVNPGELIDFLLGWTTADIFSDDVGDARRNTH